MFDFADEQTTETVSSGADLTKRCPDGSAVFSAGNFSKTLAFVEVKPFTDASDDYKLNDDLIRLGVFAKNTIDTHHSTNVMVIQAVGMNLTFYLVQKTSNESYTMFELDCLRFPSSIHDMAMIFGLMDKLMDIVQIFRTFCSTEQNNNSEIFRETMKSPILRAMTTLTSSRKRKSYNQQAYF